MRHQHPNKIVSRVHHVDYLTLPFALKNIKEPQVRQSSQYYILNRVITPNLKNITEGKVRPAKRKNSSDYPTPLNTFYGGCLRAYRRQWQACQAPKAILDMITGMRLPFTSKPVLAPSSPNNIERFRTMESTEMTKQIMSLLEQQVLEETDQTQLGMSFFSQIFLRKKKDCSNRPILNLKRLNHHIIPKKFMLLSHFRIPTFLQRQDWMAKIDLSSAYFHVPITESHRRFLRVPFGLSCAPKNFATITNWVAHSLRKKGLRLMVYLDDFLLANQSEQQLERDILTAVQFLKHLGWTINHEKSVLSPTQDLEYLGINWNTSENIKSLPQKKIDSISSLADKILKAKTITLKECQKLIGTLNFANFVTPSGRLHCRHLQRLCRTMATQTSTRRLFMTLPARSDLLWWLMTTTRSLTSSLLHENPVQHFLTTDAADYGWGAHLDDYMVSGKWSYSQMTWHCNCKEMFAIISAIKSFGHILKKSHVLVQSDNRTVVAYIRNEGGTRSELLLELTHRLFQILHKWRITLTAEYLPGQFNRIADSLSRGKKHSEWHLLKPALKIIFRKFGKPEIDLFASKNTKVLENYVSKDPRDFSAVFCNAFSRKWTYKLAWLYPPPSLIPRHIT